MLIGSEVSGNVGGANRGGEEVSGKYGNEVCIISKRLFGFPSV